MLKKLSSTDGKAINLLLDHAGNKSAKAVDMPGYSEPDESVRERLASASKVLSLLSQLPAEEPPADLVRRTLERIQHHVMTGMPATNDQINPFGPTA